MPRWPDFEWLAMMATLVIYLVTLGYAFRALVGIW